MTIVNSWETKNGYENSVTKAFSLKNDGDVKTLNFCMNKKTGAFTGKVTKAPTGQKVSGATIYWDDPSAGKNNVVLGQTDSNGWFSIQNIDVGTYNGVYADFFDWKSAKDTVVINANQTTVDNFVISSPHTNPAGSLSYKSNTTQSITLSYSYSNGSNVSLFNGSNRVITFGSGSGSGSYTVGSLMLGTTYNFYLRNGSSVGSTLLDSVSASTKAKTYLDIGLRYYDGTNIVHIAIDPTLPSPLRIAKNGKIYNIALVSITDPKASKLRVMTSSGIKALRKF